MNSIKYIIFYDIIKKFSDYGIREYSLQINIKKLVNIINEDLDALIRKDPASKNKEVAYFSHLGFQAVFNYRIANTLCNIKTKSKSEENFLLSKAKQISEDSKIKTGVEIHPRATIGKRFIIDHAIGIVIGETTLVGDDCYFLQNVILGAKSISGNCSTSRHPKIGNNVQIASNVKIFGNIEIGDYVFIGHDCVITQNIPSNSYVSSISNSKKINISFKRKWA